MLLMPLTRVHLDMASHLYFVKQWIWFCLEGAEVNPMRRWTGSCDDFEDGLIEAFVLTCSCRFITWPHRSGFSL